MTKVTGDLISIDDSAYDGFKGMTVYGKTVQNLWVNPNGTSSGITVESNVDGSFSLSGTATAESSLSLGNFYTLRPSTSYTASIDKAFAPVSIRIEESTGTRHYLSGSGPVTFVTDADIEYFKIVIAFAAGVTASGTYRAMLREATPEEIAKAASTPQTLPVYPDGAPDASDEELGIMPLDGVSTLSDSDFDDYWCPPGLSSIDEVEVVTAGKNLLGIGRPNTRHSIDRGIDFTLNNDGSITCVGSSTGPSNTFTALYGGDMYDLPQAYLEQGTYHYETVGGHTIADGGFQVTIRIGNLDDENFHIASSVRGRFTLAKPTRVSAYLVIGEGASDINETFYISITKDDATGEKLPSAKSAPVNLSTHSLRSLPDGTRDELQIDAEGNCTLVKRVGKTVFGGMTSMFNSAAEGLKGFYKNGVDDGAGIKQTSYPYMCNTLSAGTTGQYPCAYLSNVNYDSEYMNFISFASSLEEINQWLNTNETILLYKLATPQTIQLDKISLPKLRKKPLVNNVWANGTASGTGFALAPEIDYEYNQWSTYCDGFKTHGKHSYFDMGCCIAARDTGTPEKKSVTATVPYMSGFYDLSKLYGAIAFEARQLMYRFEFVEDSREELQRKKSQFLEWLSQVHDEEIADDDIPGRHFIGSLSEWEFEEGEEGQSGSLEVTFNCQPFLEADEDTTKTCNAGSNTVTVEGQAVNAYAKTSSGTATIRIGGVTQSVGTTEIRLSVQLQPGDNAVTVTGSPVTLRWKELTV